MMEPGHTEAGAGALALAKSEESVSEAAEFLKAIAHPGRLQILCHLVDGGRSVGEIADAVGVPQPVASQQLSRLRLAGIVKAERHGRCMTYSLAEPETAALIDVVRRRFCSTD